MDCFKLDAAHEASPFGWEICSNKASCFCSHVSEVYRYNADVDWKSIEGSQIGKIYKQVL